MKTKVSETSISSFHSTDIQDLMSTQFQRVADHVVEQTKHGKESCIGSVWEHFAKSETKGLGQISSVSRVCNELAKPDAEIIVGGREYRYEARPAKKFGRGVVKHFCLVLKQKPANEGAQIEMF